MKKNVLIMGGGEIGTAISKLLSNSSVAETELYDEKESLCSSSTDLLTLLGNANFIFLCIPSRAIEGCVLNLKNRLESKPTIISLTKGLGPDSKKFSGELLIESFGEDNVAVLGGPMLAEEIMEGLSTSATLGSTKETFEKVAKLFENTGLSLEHSTDIQGVSVAGVLKNIYAIGLSIADALELGANAKGVLNKFAVSEMGVLTQTLGGRPETVLEFAGVGDLVATANSPHSKNREFGRKMAEGDFDGMESEGSSSLPFLIERLAGKQIPKFLNAIIRIVLDKADAKSVFKSLIG